jgi:serine/threonine-protein kinase
MDTNAEQRRAAERIGRVLCGKWALEAVVGIGGLAVVYAATHRAGRRVAVKMLHPEVSASPEIRARFVREAHVANRIGHPGVVPVIDDDVTEHGEAFLVMELLDGETLQQRRKRWGGRLPPAEVLRYADAVLDVLVAAHAKGILHRDIKLENLFVTRDGRVVVLDFGLAGLIGSASDGATIVGLPMGSPPFMSPEQATGQWEKVDARSDVFSVAASMYRAMTGAFIHGSGTPSQLLVSACTKQAPSIRTRLPELPEPVARVIDRALAFDPAQRFQSAHEMQGAVREAMAALNQLAPLSQLTPLEAPSRLSIHGELTVGEVERQVGHEELDGALEPRLATATPVTHTSPRMGALRAPDRSTRAALIGGAVAVGVALGALVFVELSSPPGNAADPVASAAASAAVPNPPAASEAPVAAATTAAPGAPPSAAPSASAATIADAKKTSSSKKTPPPPPKPKGRESDDDLLGFGKRKR